MTTTTKEKQQHLHDMGYAPGPIDGIAGPSTWRAAWRFFVDYMDENQPKPATVVPGAWLVPAKMERVILHWTAGKWKASSIDREHYHIIIEDDGKLIRGVNIALNEDPVKAGYAAGVLNCNSGSIHVAMCGMLGAKEVPFDPGDYPINKIQWEAAVQVTVDLCRFYSIPVSPKTVLSHAEVQPTLGIKQRGKWDIARLPWALEVFGPLAVGYVLRTEVTEAM